MNDKGEETQDRLIEKARQGDHGAMAALIDRHARELREYIQAELGDRLRQRLESADVMQQVCLDALEGVKKFVDRGEGSFLAWLRRIAANRICDVDRRAFQTERRGGEVRMSDLEDDPSVRNLLDRLSKSVTTPSRAAGREEHIALLARALEGLSEPHREVVRLRYLEQLDVDETAKRMGRSERAVRSLSVRALIQLKELLGDSI